MKYQTIFLHLPIVHSILGWLQNDLQNNLRISNCEKFPEVTCLHTHFNIKIASKANLWPKLESLTCG